MTERTVLITGATGFAGSFLVERYVELGWRVHGTYRDPVEAEDWVPDRARLHPLDLLDRRAVDRLVDETRPDVVQHLAARSSAGASFADPLGTIADNTRMQWNVLEACAAYAPNARVVVVGSCDEYGNVDPDENPVTEEAQLRPISPYGISKVVQDTMGYQYAVTRGLDVVRVRPFLQTGPRRPDEFAVGSFARQIAEIEAGLRPRVVEVGNVDLERDFTDVRDVAAAYQLAAEYGKNGGVYNIASGAPHSLRDLVMVMLRASGVAARIEVRESRVRPGEPPVLVGDAKRLREATGWTPNISFEQSAADSVADWRERVRRIQAVQGAV